MEIFLFFFCFFFFFFVVVSLTQILQSTNRESLLRNGWDILDIIVIGLGWLGFGLKEDSALSALRVVRILRPLRTVKSIPGLSILIRALLRSGSQLAAVSSLSAFVFVIFGVVGINLFAGKLRQRCVVYSLDTDTYAYPDAGTNRFCALPGTTLGGGRLCSSVYGANATCVVTDENPNSGVTSFDNIGLAFLSIFQCATLEGWSNIMHAIRDTTGAASQVYFVVLVFVGSLFLLNVFIAIIVVNYSQERHLDRMDEDDKRINVLIELADDDEEDDGPTTTAKSALDISVVLSARQRRKAAAARKAKKDLRRFVERQGLSLREEIDLRLILSYELRATEDGEAYNVVSASQYEELAQKYKKQYERWKALALPEIKAVEKAELAAGTTKFSASGGGAASRSRYFETRKKRAMRLGRMASMKSARFDPKDPRAALRAAAASANPQSTAGPLTLGGLTVSDVVPGSRIGGMVRSAVVAPLDAAAKPLDAVDSLATAATTLATTTADGALELAATPALALRDAVLDDSSPLGGRDDAAELRRRAFALVTHAYFEPCVFMLILLNTGLLASFHFGQSQEWANVLRVSNVVLTSLFAVEMAVKWIALGLRYYFANPWNVFDAIVVTVGLAEILVLNRVLVDSEFLEYASVFRAVRLLRVFRLAKRWRSLRRLLLTIGTTLRNVLSFSALLFLFLFVFTVAGLHLFGGQFALDPSSLEFQSCNTPLGLAKWGTAYCPNRTNYDTFLWAFVTTFQVLTGENWNEVLYLAAGSNVGIAVSALYFVVFVLLGSLIVLNLFLGVLIDAFLYGQVELDEEDARRNEKRRERQSLEYTGLSVFRSFKKLAFVRKTQPVHNKASNDSIECDFDPEDETVDPIRIALHHKNVRKHKEAKHRPQHASCFGRFAPDASVRVKCADLVCHPLFDAVVLVAILYSCILLVLAPDPKLNDLQAYSNIALAVVFALEASLKILAFGFVSTPESYLRDPWNVLDGVLVVTAFVALAPGLSGASGVRAFRGLRALRPLRVIRRFAGLRVAVVSLGRAVTPVVELGAGCLLFLLIFAILSVQLYGGRTQGCYEAPVVGASPDPPFLTSSFSRAYNASLCWPHYANAPESELCALQSNTTHCVASNPLDDSLVWSNPSYTSGTTFSFDNVGSAMLVLYEVASLELWVQPMWAATDATQVGINPVRGSSDYSSLFFVVFVLFASLLLVQLFIAVIIDSFQRSQAEHDGKAFLTLSQQEWIRSKQKAMKLKMHHVPLPPHDFQIRRKVWYFVTDSRVEGAISAVILLNTLVLASFHFRPSQTYVQFYELCDYVFGSVYVVEFALKLVAFGVKGYFSQRQNVVDFVVVLAVVLGWALVGVGLSDSATKILAVIEIIRAFRLVRVLSYSRGVRQLLNTVSASVPALVNVAGLVFVVFFVYAALGMSLFGQLYTVSELESAKLIYLSEYVNFNDFGAAFVTLFAMSTGESWNGVMRELQIRQPAAVPYCVSFILIVQYCMINLFVAVILTDLEDEIQKKRLGRMNRISPRSLRQYAVVWAQVRAEYEKTVARLPKHATSVGATKLRTEFARLTDGSRAVLHPRMRLPATLLPILLKRLSPPLGVLGLGCSKASLLQIVASIKVPVSSDETFRSIHYHSTLSTLVDFAVLGGEKNEYLREMLASKQTPQQRNYEERMRTAQETQFTAAEIVAAKTIVPAMQAWTERERRKNAS